MVSKVKLCDSCTNSFTDDGVVCSYHYWYDDEWCSKCCQPRYVHGIDIANVNKEYKNSLCSSCLLKRQLFIEQYKEMLWI